MPEIFINGRFLCQRATGVQRVAIEFITALDRLITRGELPGLTATVIAPAGADATALSLERVTIDYVAGGAGYLWEQIALPRRVGRNLLLCLGNTAPIYSLIAGNQVAVMLHDQSFRLFPKDYKLSYRIAHEIMGYFIIRRAKPLITVSETEAINLRRYNPTLKRSIVVAPNGSKSRDLLPDLSHIRKSPLRFALHVGGFSERKNFDAVFYIASELARLGVAFKFVGEPNAHAKSLLQDLDPDLRRYICFTGFVSDGELENLYKTAACLLYPSLYEASGLPPSEAMTFGCPVVVSDLPVLRERCGSAAVYCDPKDNAGLLNSVLKVVRDPQFAADLSARGYDQVRQFTWENQARIVAAAMLK